MNENFRALPCAIQQVTTSGDDGGKNDLMMRAKHTRLVHAFVPSSVQVAQLVRCVHENAPIVGVEDGVGWTEASDVDVVKKMSMGMGSNKFELQSKQIHGKLLLKLGGT